MIWHKEDFTIPERNVPDSFVDAGSLKYKKIRLRRTFVHTCVHMKILFSFPKILFHET